MTQDTSSREEVDNAPRYDLFQYISQIAGELAALAERSEAPRLAQYLDEARTEAARLRDLDQMDG